VWVAPTGSSPGSGTCKYISFANRNRINQEIIKGRASFLKGQCHEII
jgi:hypothetical protein